VSTTPDLFVFMGADNGLLSLATVPQVKAFQDSTIIQTRSLLHVRCLIRRRRSGSAPHRKRL
jgi:hypothetical protein